MRREKQSFEDWFVELRWVIEQDTGLQFDELRFASPDAWRELYDAGFSPLDAWALDEELAA